ncbi:MAG: UDP-4-amino-4,6-dideoxy-N-acetyl-beta-L-altrosamine transaminase [Desulfovibrio sp.]|nr:UDP-4-amino-4,6-dideoxy-N-acetyl-beta-L-altrosamine transaminase [Desulfovibrio sp.]MBI4959113.1 UDP-4-amino-4,6-dideoxy-N-acetyl-beta-L-altrosamine transaminase [Desulfovibrio sp.]
MSTKPFIPYGRQSINDDDVAAVVAALRSDWLTTGPLVDVFEQAVASRCGASQGVAVSSGTAALHVATAAFDIEPGDEVIVPSLTFAATANCVVYQGATPIFADVDPETLLVSPSDVERLLTERTRAVIPVDYAGQPCDYKTLARITNTRSLHLIADACHSLGAELNGRPVGTLADATVLSFHPVKHIATGEGGMVLTNDSVAASRMRCLRNHGMNLDARSREKAGTFGYEIKELGWNYRLTDIQSALGISQLSRLDSFLAKRRDIAARYSDAFLSRKDFTFLATRDGVRHAHHLYVIRIADEMPDGMRDMVVGRLRAEGIGVNVHYPPVHMHPFYQRKFGYGPGMCPNAEKAAKRVLSLPLHPGLDDDAVERIIDATLRTFDHLM